MGLDLKLLPALDERCDFSHDILQMERDGAIFVKVLELEKSKGIDCPRGGFNSYTGEDETGKWEEPCYSKTETTKYGDRIKSVLAKELSECLSNCEMIDWRNKAVLNYVKNCPQNLPIYLYWH